uniref:Death domain-containing protein n=1 Tax=Leptobrachium leishanense TaxID=445787 RepID=A0A8C5PX51_9ANUR
MLGSCSGFADSHGNTPLHYAAHAGSKEKVNELLQGGCNVLHQSGSGLTPLHFAAFGGCNDILECLLLRVPEAINIQSIKVLCANANAYAIFCFIFQDQLNLLLSKISFRRMQSSPNGTVVHPDESLSHRRLSSPEGHISSNVFTYGLEKKAKLFVCGHSGVGKTTFTNTLRQVTRIHFCLPYHTGVPFVIWDFAGQMEYYFTHSLLLKTSGANTVYCVIFNLEGIESDLSGGQRQTIKEIFFWLRLLSVTRGSDSCHHLILIGSHLDTLKEKCRLEMANCFFSSMMKQELELFKCFKIQFFPMNCKSLNDMQPVREELGKIISQVLQLLYLPQCSSSATHTLNCDFSFSSTRKHGGTINHISHNNIPTCSALRCCSCPQGIPPPSGLVVLDLPWLLQTICGKFGNLLLSPASGQEKECWSFPEMESTLELQDGEGDTETALHLLESLELLLQTDEGYYVVPAWLRCGCPEEQMVWRNVKGVVYHWQETSRGIFSQFLIGQLQIWLLRQFGSKRCRLWREGAQCRVRAEAAVKIEISEDRRSLVMIGSWDQECSEGVCYQHLEMVGMEVESLLRKCQDQGWVKLHLIPRELLRRADGFTGFSWEEILKAEQECTTLCGRYAEAQPWEVLFPQHDHRMLRLLGRHCSIHWLEGNTLATLCNLLDVSHPLGLDWRRLAEELEGATCKVVAEINAEACRKAVSPTRLVLEKYSCSVEKLINALKQMEREDCVIELETMMKLL